MVICLIISFYFIIIYTMKNTANLSIDERFALLEEAENFFKDLPKEFEHLWKPKWASLGTVRECLELFQKKILKGEEWTEETLREWLETVIDEEYIWQMLAIANFDEEQEDFYLWWFGLATWIMLNNKEAIDGLRELQEEREKLPVPQRTLKDLVS